MLLFIKFLCHFTLVLTAFVSSSEANDNVADFITSIHYEEDEYFQKTLRLKHPTAAAPHGVVLLRIKFFDNFDVVFEDFCLFQGFMEECNVIRESILREYMQALHQYESSGLKLPRQKKSSKMVSCFGATVSDQQCLDVVNTSDSTSKNSPCFQLKNEIGSTIDITLSAESKLTKLQEKTQLGNIGAETFKDGGKLLTLVSGWWNITHNKHGNDLYFNNWFPNTLRLNMPTIFFTPHDNFDLIAQYRKGICTVFIDHEMVDFKAASFFKSKWVHEIHVPSPELGLIWTEKMNLMLLAWKVSDSEYFAYVDAALNQFRNKLPPPDEFSANIIRSLPINRVSYSYVKDYYDTHSFSGGVLIMHRSIVPLVHHLFYQELRQMAYEIDSWLCGSDQIIFTRLRDKYPELFHAASYDYGDIHYLWGNRYGPEPLALPFNSTYHYRV